MWENINGELIWIDKEMGWEEYERYNSVGDDQVCACDDVRSHGDRLSSGGIAVGVAGGMIAAKAVPKIGGVLLWIAIFLTVLMVLM